MSTGVLRRLPRPETLRGTGRGGMSGGDAIFRGLTTMLAAASIVIVVALVILLFLDARLALVQNGVRFLTESVWDPVFLRFGAAAYIYGTLVTSVLALLLATPVAVGAALFIVEYAPPWLRGPVSFTMELLAVIPSVIYGLWGFLVLAPVMRYWVEPFLQAATTSLPVISALFSGPIYGRDFLIGGIILAIMILPTVMAISREVIAAVPATQREGMVALGATKWETIRLAVLPYARVGVLGAAILGLGRALGETMAVTMVIGNSSTRLSPSLYTPGYTMASAIANQFTEADSEAYFSAVVAVALALLLVATLVNIAARLLVWRVAGGQDAAIRAG